MLSHRYDLLVSVMGEDKMLNGLRYQDEIACGAVEVCFMCLPDYVFHVNHLCHHPVQVRL